MKTALNLWLLGTAIVVSGCSGDNLPKTVPAEGVVTLDGQPVENAIVVFMADQGNHNASGNTNKDGRFSMKAFDSKSGAVPGSYKVQISKTLMEEKGGGELNFKFGLPQKYSSFTTSGLTQTVGDQGSKDIKFELKSK